MIEMGTNQPGEVAILREIVEPDIAVVTSIAEEHLEGLGDLAGVLREEAAVYDGVAVGDRAVGAARDRRGSARKGEAGDRRRPRAWTRT